MESNWRSAARKAEAQHSDGHKASGSNSDNKYRNNYNSSTSTSTSGSGNNRKAFHSKNDTRRPHADRRNYDDAGAEAGSGFAKNYKVGGRHAPISSRGPGARTDSSSGDRGGKNHQHRENVSTCSDDIEVGTDILYEGFVHAIKYGREGGLYCTFGLVGTSGYTNKGMVSRIFFNNCEKRPFQKGDKITVHCVSKIPTVELCLTSEYVRPLLVLDINGPLGERSSYNPGEPSKKRIFNKRNHLQEFLQFVSEHFEVAVWSCSTRKNLELSLFAGINLVFVWCQEESTSLYPRTSFISPAKPLFLKEISKVWLKYPSFNASNTLILDNHIEKYERNPYGTGIIVPDEQEKGTPDSVLALDSDLCQHLLAMVTQRPVDMCTYVSNLGGSSPLFPIEYPVPPASEAVTAQLSTATLNSTAECESQHLDGPAFQTSHLNSTHQVQEMQREAPLPSSDDLAWQYVYAVCNNNAKVANVHVKKRSLPGPKTSALHRKDMQVVSSPEYVVCEKTDGERIILVINPEHGVVYFVRRNLSVDILTLGNIFNQQELSQWVRGLNGLTVLDGELVLEYCSDGSQKQRQAFLCFDAIIVNGDFIGKSHSVTLPQRMSKADSFLAKSPLYFFAFSPLPLIFKCKEFTTVSDISSVVARLFPLYSGGDKAQELLGWVYDAPELDSLATQSSTAFPHLSDGLVFTPVNKTYYDYIAYKWKPAHMCTVDFAVSMGEVSNALQRKAQVFSVGGSVLSHSDSMLQLNQVWITRQQGIEIMQCDVSSTTLVVECAFDAELGQWVLKKNRLDRPVPNSLRTAWSNLEVVAEAVTLECIVEYIGKHKQAFSSVRSPSDHVAEVSMHYDQVQASRQTGFREERIAVHRKVMNWAKACLFKSTMFFTPTKADQSDGSLLAALQQQHAEYLKGKICFPNLNRPEKKAKKPTGNTGPINVLDIACGRGGDVKKFTSDNSVNIYVGIDISPEQLKDCEDRARNNHGVKQCVTSLGDASTGTWKDVIKRATNKPSSNQFDVAWCMFALHYFCDNEDTLRQLFIHLADSLKVGGKFACTFPNPYYIYDQLRRAEIDTSDRSVLDEDKIYKIRKDATSERPFDLSLEECLKTFGNAYQFSLGDAVQDCKEFIVPFERVLEIAGEAGFSVCSFDSGVPMALSMNSWISQPCLTSDGLMGLRRVMGVTGAKGAGRDLSSEEWEAISLYMCVVWVKSA